MDTAMRSSISHKYVSAFFICLFIYQFISIFTLTLHMFVRVYFISIFCVLPSVFAIPFILHFLCSIFLIMLFLSSFVTVFLNIESNLFFRMTHERLLVRSQFPCAVCSCTLGDKAKHYPELL